MSDMRKETFSALFDGETTDFETQRLLQNLSATEKEAWRRYQLIHLAATKSLTEDALKVDVTAAVAAAIADDDVAIPANKDKYPFWKAPISGLHWLKPVAGFAAAASVAFVVVIGIDQNDTQFVAGGDVSSSQLPMTTESGLSTVNAKIAENPEAVDSEKQQQQFNDFYIEHFLRSGVKKSQ